MKKEIQKISEDTILKKFPIRAETPGWYFLKNEIANNAWEVEGTDRWGRIVYRQGNNLEGLMAECEIEATRINIQAGST